MVAFQFMLTSSVLDGMVPIVITGCYEERAILLSRIGQHDQALNIYVHKLNNFQAAEE